MGAVVGVAGAAVLGGGQVGCAGCPSSARVDGQRQGRRGPAGGIEHGVAPVVAQAGVDRVQAIGQAAQRKGVAARGDVALLQCARGQHGAGGIDQRQGVAHHGRAPGTGRQSHCDAGRGVGGLVVGAGGTAVIVRHQVGQARSRQCGGEDGNAAGHGGAVARGVGGGQAQGFPCSFAQSGVVIGRQRVRPAGAVECGGDRALAGARAQRQRQLHACFGTAAQGDALGFVLCVDGVIVRHHSHAAAGGDVVENEVQRSAQAAHVARQVGGTTPHTVVARRGQGTAQCGAPVAVLVGGDGGKSGAAAAQEQGHLAPWFGGAIEHGQGVAGQAVGAADAAVGGHTHARHHGRQGRHGVYRENLRAQHAQIARRVFDLQAQVVRAFGHHAGAGVAPCTCAGVGGHHGQGLPIQAQPNAAAWLGHACECQCGALGQLGIGRAVEHQRGDRIGRGLVNGQGKSAGHAAGVARQIGGSGKESVVARCDGQRPQVKLPLTQVIGHHAAHLVGAGLAIEEDTDQGIRLRGAAQLQGVHAGQRIAVAEAGIRAHARDHGAWWGIVVHHQRERR